MSQPETIFKRRVIRDLRTLKGIYILKTQERARRGVPDLLISLGGRFIAIELKVEGEEPTRLQEVRLRAIQRSGGVAFWTTPAAWDMHFSMLKNGTRVGLNGW